MGITRKKKVILKKINENMSIFMPCITPSLMHYPMHKFLVYGIITYGYKLQQCIVKRSQNLHPILVFLILIQSVNFIVIYRWTVFIEVKKNSKLGGDFDPKINSIPNERFYIHSLMARI